MDLYASESFFFVAFNNLQMLCEYNKLFHPSATRGFLIPELFYCCRYCISFPINPLLFELGKKIFYMKSICCVSTMSGRRDGYISFCNDY